MTRKGPGQTLSSPRPPDPGAASSSQRGVVRTAQPWGAGTLDTGGPLRRGQVAETRAEGGLQLQPIQPGPGHGSEGAGPLWGLGTPSSRCVRGTGQDGAAQNTRDSSQPGRPGA